MATLAELETAFIAADNAGDTESAQMFADVLRNEYSRRQADPSIAQLEIGSEPLDVPGTVAPPAEPSMTDRAVGALETGATLATGATAGAVGQVGGTIEGIIEEVLAGNFGSAEAAKRIENMAMQRAEQFTYTPRTETGQEYVQAVGEALAPLAALPPVAEAQMAAGAASRIPARQLASEVRQDTQDIARQVRESLPSPKAERQGLSVGAAEVDAPVLRQAQADELPIPIQLTKGQRTRDFGDQRFEKETAKLPEAGAPLRDRFEEQNAQLAGNLDSFIDDTGAQLTDLVDVGSAITKALGTRLARDKVKVRSLYKKAEEAGETAEEFAPVSLVEFLNENVNIGPNAPVLETARKELVRRGGAVVGDEGTLIPTPISINSAEELRKQIGKIQRTSSDATNASFAGAAKASIDTDTKDLGGNEYKAARTARAKMAEEYEKNKLTSDLINTKPNSDDRKIALENAVSTILRPATPLASLEHVKRLLNSGQGSLKLSSVKGAEKSLAAKLEGKQAWAELQGATLQNIKDQMFKSVATNQRSDRVASAAQLDKAISTLDRSGKLDVLFGKKGAENLRTINEITKVVVTAPPGAVNTSNTATTLATLIDLATTSYTGFPAPVAWSLKTIVGGLKDRKLKKRINDALGE